MPRRWQRSTRVLIPTKVGISTQRTVAGRLRLSNARSRAALGMTEAWLRRVSHNLACCAGMTEKKPFAHEQKGDRSASVPMSEISLDLTSPPEAASVPALLARQLFLVVDRLWQQLILGFED